VIQKILVPIDGSEHADKALDYALDLGDKYDAEIEIYNVIPTAAVWMLPQQRTSSQDLMQLQASHEELLAEASTKTMKAKPELTVTTRLDEGRAADEIITRVKRGNFDLIVMGSRGLGGIKEFFLGSVSNRVADEAQSPVLIIK
jgi:nucleotide-binding universal stress UspA family protein